MRVSDLFIYPLKSARGIAVESSTVDAFGLLGDRRMMIVEPSGRFITQRDMQELARIEVEPHANFLRLKMEGRDHFDIVPPRSDSRMDVEIWKTNVNAAIAGEAANETLSEWLDRPVKLAFFDGLAERTASAEWDAMGSPVTFADGFQALVTTTGSLKALNDDLALHGEGSVGMDRFRPNIVIDCDEAWPEDKWSAIDVGGIRFDLVKPCSRCIMTTQDQHTGSRDVPNPMPAMGRIRMSADRRVPGPLFGWNAVPRGEGVIAIGDTVTVIEHRPEGWALKRR